MIFQPRQLLNSGLRHTIVSLIVVEPQNLILLYTWESFASVIVDCWYGKKGFPVRLSYQHIHSLLGCPPVIIVEKRYGFNGPTVLVHDNISCVFSFFSYNAPHARCEKMHPPIGHGELEHQHCQIHNQNSKLDNIFMLALLSTIFRWCSPLLVTILLTYRWLELK